MSWDPQRGQHDIAGMGQWPAPGASSPPSASQYQSQQVYVGRYQVIQLLAEGGMSRVYRALDTPLAREVALKVLAPGLAHDPIRVERFRLEARRVAALSHPHIVPLLEYGEEGDTFYLVMPFYKRALRETLQEWGVLSLADAVTVTTQVASALDYAHQQGLIHRDVKPENILIDDTGHALLTDFGIAKAAPTAPSTLATARPLMAAEAGQMPIASVEYSAPEHLLGRPTDPRSDVYGLGIVVYEMLTGHVPFPLTSEHVYTTIMRMLTEPPTPPSLLAPTLLPPTLDAVVLRALESDPRRRYASTGEFSLALAQLLNSSGSLSPQPSAEYRPHRQPPQSPHSPQRPQTAPPPRQPVQRPQQRSQQPAAPRPRPASPRPIVAPPLSPPAPPGSGPLRFLRKKPKQQH